TFSALQLNVWITRIARLLNDRIFPATQRSVCVTARSLSTVHLLCGVSCGGIIYSTIVPMRMLIATLFMAVSFAQSPPGSISGTVVKAGTGEVVRKATLVLMRMDGTARVSTDGAIQQYTANSDAVGRFAFVNVAPGTYRLSANLGGYVRSEYGQ